MKRTSTILAAFFVAFFAQSSYAQTHAPTLGEKPFQSTSGGGFDHVNVENGGLFVHIPLISLPQRGKLNMSFSVTGNGSQYEASAFCDPSGNCEYGYTHYNPCMESNTYLGDDGSANLSFTWDQPHTICGLHHLEQTEGIDDWGVGDGVYTVWQNSDDGGVDQEMLPGLPTEGGLGDDEFQEWNEFKLIDSDGAAHVFGYDQTDYPRLKTNDGTGYVLDMEDVRTTIKDAMKFPGDSYSILGPDGIRERFIRSGPTPSEDMVMSDPAGNAITWNYINGLTDSIGRHIDYIQPSNAGTSTVGCPVISGQPSADASQFWTVSDATGTEVLRYQLCYATVSIDTNFFGMNGASTYWCRDDSDSAGDPTSECFYYDETTLSEEKLQSVVLPNKTFWGFSYTQPDADGISYGDLSAIRLPSGGEIQYAYDNVAACGNWAGEQGPPVGHVVVQRTLVPLVGPTQTTRYTYLQADWTTNFDRVIELDDAGNEIVHSLTGPFTAQGLPCKVVDSDTKYYQGSHTSGTLLRETVRNFSSVPTAQQYRLGQPPSFTGYGSTDRLLNSEADYQNGVLVSQKTYQYDPWYTDVQPLVDLVTGPDVFELHPVQPTIVLLNATSVSDGVKTVVTNRLAKTNSSYAAAGLLYIPADQSILDDQGTPVAKTVFGYDEMGSPQGIYGNNTSKRDVSLTSGVPDSLITTTYNANGMPITTTDARGNAGEAGNHTTTLTYDSTGTFVSRVDRPTTNGQAHTSYFGTDPTLGVLLWQSDENASGPNDPAHTTTYTYDPIGRAVNAVFPPGGGSTQVCFSDETIAGCGAAGSPPYTVQVSVQTGTSAGPQMTSTQYDGLGRVSSRTAAPGASIASSVDTTYDSEGHVYSVSNPHGSTASPTDGLTTFTYDALGRKHLQTNPDLTTLQWNYSGNTVTSIDESGSSWQHTSDVAGRLVQVVEPGGLNTTYSYDALNNLKCADQWGTATIGSPCSSSKMRQFQYDSFSRLLWAQNPETGVVCYGQGTGAVYGCQPNGYDPNGNLLYKTDARGVSFSYNYDSLNRLTGKYASDGTVADTYHYDQTAQGPNQIGRLGFPDHYGAAGNGLYYDAMGRIVETTYAAPGSNGWQDGMHATYDLAGNMTSITYPDGRIVDQVFDGAGRLAKVSNRAAGGTPAYDFMYGPSTLSNPGDTATGGIQYTAAGAPQSFVFGNGVGQFNGYNNRLQPCHTMASTPVLGGTINALLTGTGPGNLLDRQSFYNSSASSPCGSEAGNNGNIYAITDNRQVGNSQSFSYDPLNRLLTAARSDGAYNHTYNYDSFGNMLLHDNLASPSSVAWNIDQTTNRLLRSHDGGTTWGDNAYDAAGNLQSVSDGISPTVTYQYNALSDLYAVNNGSTASYVYNGLDERVYKGTATGWTDYVYLNGQPMAEHTSDGTWTDYIYANGQKIAREAPASSIWMHGANSDPVEARVELSLGRSISIGVGDHLNFAQYQASSGGMVAGMNLIFDNGWQLNGSCGSCAGQPAAAVDQNSVAVDKWNANYATNYRSVDLRNFAGHSVTGAEILKDISAPGGSWDILVSFIAVTHADGSVDTIYNSTDPIGLDMPAEPNLSNNWASYSGVPGPNTRYYIDDHLGTTQMELSPGGWPVWQGQFTPFGQEIVNGAPLLPGQSDGSSMHYKFTGKERDAESGLDYFGARYYASSVGRWMSPDWASKPEAVPYSDLGNPQSLNLYGYVKNNPLSNADQDGHCCDLSNPGDVADTLLTAHYVLKKVATALAKQYLANGNALATDPNAGYRMAFSMALGAVTPIPGESPVGAAEVGEAEIGTITIAPISTETTLTGLASQAVEEIGPGRGAAYGTAVHTKFEGLVNGLGKSDLSTEVSYLEGKVVPRGTAGSIRVDVAEGSITSPTHIYDLKTGSASLTQARIKQIQSQIPGGSNVPVTQIRPTQ